MRHRVETLTEAFALPEDALCLTPTGWRPEAYEVIIQFEPPMTLERALDSIWTQHGNLLGFGSLVFKQVTAEPKPKGYIVFVPASDS